MKFGLPDEIRSDNGSEYINTELTHLCNYFEIKFKQVQHMHLGLTV